MPAHLIKTTSVLQKWIGLDTLKISAGRRNVCPWRITSSRPPFQCNPNCPSILLMGDRESPRNIEMKGELEVCSGKTEQMNTITLSNCANSLLDLSH